MKFAISHPKDTNMKIPIRKLFEKGRNRLDLKNFRKKPSLLQVTQVKLFELNILLVPKLPCGQKEAQQIAGAGKIFPGFLLGSIQSLCFLLSFQLFLLPHVTMPCFWCHLVQLQGTSWVPVLWWPLSLSDLVYGLWPSQRVSSGQTMVPWPPVCCQSKLAAALAQGSSATGWALPWQPKLIPAAIF